MRLLLEYGADYRTIDAFGEGILHWLAGSGLEMLRLFKGLGIIHGVDVERRDNRGKTAIEIMEGRWDLTDEFRREFMELLDGIGDEVVEEERVGVDGGVAQVAEIEDQKEDEDEDLSEADDEFFDAQDDLSTSSVALKKQGLPSTAKEPLCDPDDSESTDSRAPPSEVLAPTEHKQQGLPHNSSEIIAHDGELLPYDSEAAADSDTNPISSGHEQDTLLDELGSKRWKLTGTDEDSHNRSSEHEYLKKPRGVELEGDKVFTDEAGVKFLGTSDALRGQ